MTSTIPLDTSCQAEYADGYILDETEHDDINPYASGANVFRGILNKEPEAEHGKMVRFSVFYQNQRHDVDWTTLPDNARPIRFRDRSQWMNDSGDTGLTDWHGCRFGYQYNDENGKNIQEVIEL